MNDFNYQPIRMRYILFICISILSITSSFAQQPIPQSREEGPVNDFANLLSRQEQNNLSRKLIRYANETSTQLVLVTEESLAGEDDFTRAMAIYDDWRIGEQGKDNGIMLYVAKQDRKVRFVTGYGAEGFLTDAMAKRIIENTIVPAFRRGQFYQGIDRAWDQVIQLGNGEYINDNPNRDSGVIPAGLIFIVILLIVIVANVVNRYGDDDDDDGGYYRGGRYDMDDRRRRRRRRNRGGGGWVIFPGGGSGGGGGGWSGGGGGGFSGGGFSGGFGGGFSGGGGAGGSW